MHVLELCQPSGSRNLIVAVHVFIIVTVGCLEFNRNRSSASVPHDSPLGHSSSQLPAVVRLTKSRKAVMAVLSRIFPEDLVIDILSRLPVKSLKRFRCVSKPWYDLIGSPNFIATHHLKQSTLNGSTGKVFVTYNNLQLGELAPSTHIIFINDITSSKPMLSTLKVGGDEDVLTVTDVVSTPFPYDNINYLYICGPCNGILCLYNFEPHVEWIALWNPATKESKTLPSSHLEPPDLIDVAFGAFEFGFDHRTNDYKMLRFICYICVEDSIDQAELYSLKSDSWRVIPLMDIDVFPWLLDITYKTYKDGVCYWWAEKTSDGSQWILSFDMVDEVFEKVRLPADFGFPTLLVFFNGHLSLVLSRDEGMEKYFDIWVMTQYGVPESLVRQLSIGPITGVKRPLGFWKNSKMFFTDKAGQLVFYDLDTKQKKFLQLDGKTYATGVLNYEESLVPLNNGE